MNGHTTGHQRARPRLSNRPRPRRQEGLRTEPPDGPSTTPPLPTEVDRPCSPIGSNGTALLSGTRSHGRRNVGSATALRSACATHFVHVLPFHHRSGYRPAGSGNQPGPAALSVVLVAGAGAGAGLVWAGVSRASMSRLASRR